MTVKKYGSTEFEKDAIDNAKCRQIVKEIINFGVTQSQLLKIIELLALELENNEHMKQISTLAKRLSENRSGKSTLITEF